MTNDNQNSNLSEEIGIKITREMKNRAKRAAEDEEYSGQSTYLRAMIHAGESQIVDLDPRTGEGQSSIEEVETVEAAAKVLNDEVILNELSQEKQEFDAVVEQLTLEFENVLADRLHGMANNDQSVVETDGRGNYYLSR